MAEENEIKESDVKVMIVDDEVDFLEAIKYWLKLKGYQVETFSKSDEALEAVKKDPPLVLFTDIVMPEMDGIDLLKEIRKFNKDLSVIVITAHSTPQRVQEAEELGVVGYFMKSDDFKQAADLIQKAIQTYKKLQ